MTGGTGNFPPVNQSVRLRPQQAELYEYRCEAGHVRTSANITATGQCRLCKSTTHKKSRWIKHEVTVQQQPKTALEQAVDLHFEVYKQREREKEIAEQQREQQRDARENQEWAAQKAYELMDATDSEQTIVNRRLAKTSCRAADYVKEIRALRGSTVHTTGCECGFCRSGFTKV